MDEPADWSSRNAVVGFEERKERASGPKSLGHWRVSCSWGRCGRGLFDAVRVVRMAGSRGRGLIEDRDKVAEGSAEGKEGTLGRLVLVAASFAVSAMVVKYFGISPGEGGTVGMPGSILSTWSAGGGGICDLVGIAVVAEVAAATG